VLRPLEERHTLLPLAVPLAVSETVEELAGGKALVKWPNDVWIDGRKAAGVLIEARPQDGWAVIGVGLNVAIAPEEFPAELRESATSLGGEATVEEAAEALNRRLADWVMASPGAVLDGFRERDALMGRRIGWDRGSGTAEGIDERGNLLVRGDEGHLETLGAGEVHLDLR
jgi:BirA family transcriptional regulator, biotin operon repressor / biotin---[acetyl-CoA-carboxylase] ligase